MSRYGWERVFLLYTVNNKILVVLVTLKCKLKIGSRKELLFMMHKIL